MHPSRCCSAFRLFGCTRCSAASRKVGQRPSLLALHNAWFRGYRTASRNIQIGLNIPCISLYPSACQLVDYRLYNINIVLGEQGSTSVEWYPLTAKPVRRRSADVMCNVNIPLSDQSPKHERKRTLIVLSAPPVINLVPVLSNVEQKTP